MDTQPSDRGSDARVEFSEKKRPPRRVSIVGIIGESFITIGAILLLFVVWELWIGDPIIAAGQYKAADNITQQWKNEQTQTPKPEVAKDVTAAPPALPQPGDGEIFGVVKIPRFGPDYAVSVAGGVSRSRTLDHIGIGHYPDTAMPGQSGNFSVAGHRTTFGAPFHRIADLQIGDAIVIETKDGWYTYRFRTLEYVKPTTVSVLEPVPQTDTVVPDGKYMTMTSCNPMYSAQERIVAYSVFDSFTPRSAGEPSSLTGGKS